MKRFLKTFVLLMAALLLLASGLNVTLDRINHFSAQDSFIWYDAQGHVVVAYTGEQALAQKLPKPVRMAAPLFLHRNG